MTLSTISDTKRNFYTDDKDVVTVPGTNTASTPEQINTLASRLVMNGVTVRTTSGLENAFRAVRETIYDAYKATGDYLNDGKTKVYNAERKVTGTVSALHNKSEDLFPNGLYIIIGGLSGSIFARQRGIVARALFPVVFGIGAFRYFLPQTFSNTTALLWKIEQRTLPDVAATQVAAVESAGSLVDRVEQSARSGQDAVVSSMTRVRKQIASATGLNLDEEVTRK